MNSHLLPSLPYEQFATGRAGSLPPVPRGRSRIGDRSGRFCDPDHVPGRPPHPILARNFPLAGVGLAARVETLIIWPLKYFGCRLPTRTGGGGSDGLSGKSLTAKRLEEDERSPKWQRRPDERRAEILDGAVLAFGRKGYKRATLADVAEHAGVCAGTVSHYFGSKARLFEEVIAERLMPFVETEEASLATHRGPMRELLDQLLRRLWDRAWEPGILELMRVVKVESAEFPESGRLLCQQLGERWRRIFGDDSHRRHGGRRVPADGCGRRRAHHQLRAVGVAEKVSVFRVVRSSDAGARGDVAGGTGDGRSVRARGAARATRQGEPE